MHFTKQQVVWQCKTCILGEDGQVAEDLQDVVPEGAKRYGPIDSQLTPVETPSEEHKAWSPEVLEQRLEELGWYELVEEYKRRSLTYPTDVLPAISAIASEIQRSTNANYAAGLWSAGVSRQTQQVPVEGLLWLPTRPCKRAHNGSPSWAWSSVLGPVMHLKGGDGANGFLDPTVERTHIAYEQPSPLFCVRNIRVELASSNPYGQVSRAKMEVAGLISTYAGAASFQYEAESADNAKRPMLTDYLDVDEPIVWTHGSFLLLYIIEHKANVSRWTAWRDLHKLDGSSDPGVRRDDLRVFLILRAAKTTTGEPPPTTAFRRVFGKGLYERIGLARLVYLGQKEDSGDKVVPSACAYTEENGWVRENLTLV